MACLKASGKILDVIALDRLKRFGYPGELKHFFYLLVRGKVFGLGLALYPTYAASTGAGTWGTSATAGVNYHSTVCSHKTS
jgi:hypothetical protein